MKPVILLLFITLGVVSCTRINLVFQDTNSLNEDFSENDAIEEASSEDVFVNPGFKNLFRKSVRDGCDPAVCNADCKKHDNGKTGRCISGECFCNDTYGIYF